MARPSMLLALAGVLCSLPLLAARASAAPAPAEALNLEDAIVQALAHNLELANQRLSAEASQLAVLSARNDFRFELSPEGSLGYSGDGEAAGAGLSVRKRNLHGTTLSARASYADLAVEREDLDKSATIRLELAQPLLRDAGRLPNEDALLRAAAGVRSAQRRLELFRIDLVLRVVNSHQDLLRAQKQIEYDQKALARYDKLYRLTKVREAQGRASRVDTLRVEFQRGQAELTLASTREQLDSRRQDLAELLGQPAGTSLWAAEGRVIEIDATDPAAAEQVALTHRLDYADAVQAIHEAARGVAVARRQLWPAIDLVTRYERLGVGADSSAAMDLDEEIWFVGLAGDSDVFRRNDRVQLSRAQIETASAENQALVLENSIRRQVRQALNAYRRAREQAEVAEHNLQLAEARARLARRLFEMGRGDNFTVTDAETELLQSESQMLQSRSESIITAYQALRILGTLLEAPEELKPKPAAAGAYSLGGPVEKRLTTYAHE